MTDKAKLCTAAVTTTETRRSLRQRVFARHDERSTDSSSPSPFLAGREPTWSQLCWCSAWPSRLPHSSGWAQFLPRRSGAARGGARENSEPTARRQCGIASASLAKRHVARRDVCPPVRQRGGRGAGVPLGFTAPAAPAAVRVRDNYRRVSRSSDLFFPVVFGKLTCIITVLG